MYADCIIVQNCMYLCDYAISQFPLFRRVVGRSKIFAVLGPSIKVNRILVLTLLHVFLQAVAQHSASELRIEDL